jgi:hypothetical protein
MRYREFLFGSLAHVHCRVHKTAFDFFSHPGIKIGGLVREVWQGERARETCEWHAWRRTLEGGAGRA